MANERVEALYRILIGIVSGAILGLWKTVVQVVAIVHFVWVLITGKRNKDLAIFCEYFNAQLYDYLHYMTFVSNERPWPFNKMNKAIKKYE